MRRLAAAALVVLATLSVPSVTAWAGNDVKIGFVELQKALNESVYGKSSKAELEEMVLQRRKDIERKVKAVEQLKADIERQSIILSEDARRDKVNQFDRLKKETERYINDSEEEFSKLQREKEVEIMNEIGGVIEAIAKEDGYTLILPAEAVIYSADELDITDKVIERYNKMKASAPQAAPAGSQAK